MITVTDEVSPHTLGIIIHDTKEGFLTFEAFTEFDNTIHGLVEYLYVMDNWFGYRNVFFDKIPVQLSFPDKASHIVYDIKKRQVEASLEDSDDEPDDEYEED